MENLLRLHRGRLPKFIIAGAFAVLASPLVLAAEGAIGAAYGAREPAQCPSRNEPAAGAPSNAQAAQYLKCFIEGIGDGRLYLLEQVNVRVDPMGHPFDPQRDYFENVDRAQSVYAITGSLVRFSCDAPIGANAGKNCTSYAETNARGSCYKMVGGNWSCNMSDLRQVTTENVAPPK